jgi:hypothetical protein
MAEAVGYTTKVGKFVYEADGQVLKISMKMRGWP